MAATPRDEESIFAQALDKPSAAERAAYLASACGDDAELRHRLVKLLQRHEEENSFLVNPLLGATTAQRLTEGPGTVIGPYELMEQIGEGGFGLVFVAEQHEPVRRKVALKIIKPGMDSGEVIARFEAERQALALMEHPNIARIFDGGTTQSGRPYFVMELVKGIPIIDYCDQQQLTARQRLDLFLTVCAAVQHAHGKGIIHRDLKPSNILVAPHDGIPVVKVIDFGIAKAIGQQLTNKKIYTRFTQMIGTPLYMSPEQAEINALDVDIRSDIYSLGVLLYELLTGTTPFDKQRFQTAAFEEIRRIIKEEEPPKPSTRLSTMGNTLPKISSQRNTVPAKLSALVKGDLDWIVMKALEKDRTRRYETASTFAADVRRFLAEEPIEARPPSTWYRFRKLARRNKVALTTTALVAAALLVGLGLSVWQAVRAHYAELAAITDRDEKEKALLVAAQKTDLAVDAQKKLEDERDTLKIARDEQRLTSYALTMSLIPNAWEADSVGRVIKLLEDLRPKPGEKDLRGPEWHYWDRLCHAERRTHRLDGAVASLTLSGDGKRFAFTQFESYSNPLSGFDVKVLDVGTDKVVRSWPFKSPDKGESIDNLYLNQDGSRLVMVMRISRARLDTETRTVDECQLVVWDVAGGEKIFAPQERFNGWPAISPDGKLLATIQSKAATAQGEPKLGTAYPVLLKIWDLANPGNKPILIECENFPSGLTFSPNGSRLAGLSTEVGKGGTTPSEGFISWGGTMIHLWDTASGELRAKESAESGRFSPSLAFSPDGKRLAAAQGLQFNNVGYHQLLWEGADGAELKLLRTTTLKTSPGIAPSSLSHMHQVYSPDGRRLAVWDGHSPVRVLDAETGAVLQVLKIQFADIDHAAFSADSAGLVTAYLRTGPFNSAALVQEWDVPMPVKAEPNVLPLEVTIPSPDGKLQATFYPPRAAKGKGGTAEKGRSEVSIRDSAGKQILVFTKHTAAVGNVTFSPDGRLVVSGVGGWEIKIWEAATGKVWWELNESKGKGNTRTRPFIHFSPDGRLLVLGNFNPLSLRDSNPLKIVATADFRELKQFDADWRSMNIAISPDSRFIAAAVVNRGKGSEIAIWDAATLVKKVSLPPDLFSTGTLVFSPDGSRLLITSGGGAGPFRSPFRETVYDVANGKVLFHLEGHSAPVSLAAFSPDGKRIATARFGINGPTSGEVKLWDAATGRELLSLKPGNITGGGPVRGNLSFSPDGMRLLYRPSVLSAIIRNTAREVVLIDATPRGDR